MRTLRDVWHDERGMSSVEVCVAVGIKSTETLYKLNRKGKEADGVAWGTVPRLCEVLELPLDEFVKLDPCPHADEYRPPHRRRKRV